MPIYEYRRPDGTTFEVHQSFNEDTLTTDPDTGVPVERVLHAPAVHFKGKGFYNTDYGTRKRQRETAGSSDESPASSTDSSSGDGSSSDSATKGDSPAKSDAKTSESSSKSAEKKSDASHSGPGKPLAAAK
jgi:putative FmdB family regulatory protein